MAAINGSITLIALPDIFNGTVWAYVKLRDQGGPDPGSHRLVGQCHVRRGARRLFAAFLGYNPIRSLLGTSLSGMPASKVEYLTGHSFFPSLISGSFQSGIHEAFYFAAGMCVLAAAASWLRGAKYVHAASDERPVLVALAGAARDGERSPQHDPRPGSRRREPATGVAAAGGE